MRSLRRLIRAYLTEMMMAPTWVGDPDPNDQTPDEFTVPDRTPAIEAYPAGPDPLTKDTAPGIGGGPRLYQRTGRS